MLAQKWSLVSCPLLAAPLGSAGPYCPWRATQMLPQRSSLLIKGLSRGVMPLLSHKCSGQTITGICLHLSHPLWMGVSSSLDHGANCNQMPTYRSYCKCVHPNPLSMPVSCISLLLRDKPLIFFFSKTPVHTAPPPPGDFPKQRQ